MRTVFFDIDTQIDFMYPAGALFVSGADEIVPRIAQLNRYAGGNGIPLISTMDAHSENDAEFLSWPYCVSGTVGQLKPAATLLESPTAITTKLNTAEYPERGQILLEKQKLDCFTNPNLTRLLEQFNAQRYVVYGVVTEICVKFAVHGLLKTGARIELVTDAVQSLDEAAAQALLDEVKDAGGSLTTASAVCV